jgi:hypothetical protein
MPAVAGAEQRENAAVVRRTIAALAENRDLRAAGMLDADPAEAPIEDFLCQTNGGEAAEATLSSLAALADRLR